MKWIKYDSGISPESDVILVFREDGSYDIAYEHYRERKYVDRNNKNILDGSRICYFINIPPIPISTNEK